MNPLDLVRDCSHTIRIPHAHLTMSVSEAVSDTAGTSTPADVKMEDIRPGL